jgi:hypothetical protein
MMRVGPRRPPRVDVIPRLQALLPDPVHTTQAVRFLEKEKGKKITEHGMQRRIAILMDRTAESRGGGGRDAHRSRTCWRGDPWRQEEARVAGGGEEAWKETRD